MAGKWVHDGTAWVATDTPPPAPAPNIQEFGSSGTWVNPDDGWVIGICELIGGGQGAGSFGSPVAIGGHYARFAFLPSQVGATESVTIGAGGYGIWSASSAGAVGGSSQFGSFPIPGPGGRIENTTVFTSLFGGGNSVNAYNIAGKPGGPSAAAYGYLQAGDGGRSALGQGYDGEPGNAPGGAGGMGGATSPHKGGPGAAGGVRITLLYVGGA